MIFAICFGGLALPVLTLVFELITRKFPEVPFNISNSIVNIGGQIYTIIIQMYKSLQYSCFLRFD